MVIHRLPQGAFDGVARLFIGGNGMFVLAADVELDAIEIENVKAVPDHHPRRLPSVAPGPLPAVVKSQIKDCCAADQVKTHKGGLSHRLVIRPAADGEENRLPGGAPAGHLGPNLFQCLWKGQEEGLAHQGIIFTAVDQLEIALRAGAQIDLFPFNKLDRVHGISLRRMRESVTDQAPVWKMYGFPAFFASFFCPQSRRVIMACFLSYSPAKDRVSSNLSF